MGLWDEAGGYLVFLNRFGETAQLRAWRWHRRPRLRMAAPVYTHRAERDAPERAEDYRRNGIRSVAAAPITSGDRRIGVLVVYAARPPAFTEDVLALIPCSPTRRRLCCAATSSFARQRRCEPRRR